MAKKSSNAIASYAGPSTAEQKRWQAEGDLQTLLRAEEIQKDKPRLAAARRLAREQLKAAEEATKI